MRLTPSVAAASFSAASRASTAAESRRARTPASRVDLLLLERLVDLEDRDRRLVLVHVAVHADDDALPRLDLRLVAERRLGDLALEEVVLDRGDDAAELRRSGRSTRTPAPRASSVSSST